jgi:hypothetical protein
MDLRTRGNFYSYGSIFSTALWIHEKKWEQTNNLWFPKGLLQRLIHYRNTMLDIAHCLRYIWYTQRFCSTPVFRWLPLLETGLVYSPNIRKVTGSILTVVTNNKEKSVSTMTTNHLKTEVKRTSETSCVSNTPQTMESVQHSLTDLYEIEIVCLHLYS